MLKAELARKGLHLLIAFVPALAALNLSNTVLLLMAGILFYACAESLRFLGFPIPVISPVTEALLREREKERFVLGPVTLGLGAILALLVFPVKAAAAAIYALAFGDSASSLAGRLLGRIRPAFMAGKSLEGSLACFIAATLGGLLVFHDLKSAALIGLASLLVDTLPLDDFDNLVYVLDGYDKPFKDMLAVKRFVQLEPRAL